MLLVGLCLAHDLLQAPVPVLLLERARNDRRIQRLARHVTERLLYTENPPRQIGASERVDVEWFQFRMLENGWDRVRFMLDRVTTPRRSQNSAMVRLGERMLPVEALMRPAHIMGKLTQVTWKRLLGRRNGQRRAYTAPTAGDTEA